VFTAKYLSGCVLLSLYSVTHVQSAHIWQSSRTTAWQNIILPINIIFTIHLYSSRRAATKYYNSLFEYFQADFGQTEYSGDFGTAIFFVGLIWLSGRCQGVWTMLCDAQLRQILFNIFVNRFTASTSTQFSLRRN